MGRQRPEKTVAGNWRAYLDDPSFGPSPVAFGIDPNKQHQGTQGDPNDPKGHNIYATNLGQQPGAVGQNLGGGFGQPPPQVSPTQYPGMNLPGTQGYGNTAVAGLTQAPRAATGALASSQVGAPNAFAPQVGRPTTPAGPPVKEQGVPATTLTPSMVSDMPANQWAPANAQLANQSLGQGATAAGAQQPGVSAARGPAQGPMPAQPDANAPPEDWEKFKGDLLAWRTGEHGPPDPTPAPAPAPTPTAPGPSGPVLDPTLGPTSPGPSGPMPDEFPGPSFPQGPPVGVPGPGASTPVTPTTGFPSEPAPRGPAATPTATPTAATPPAATPPPVTFPATPPVTPPSYRPPTAGPAPPPMTTPGTPPLRPGPAPQSGISAPGTGRAPTRYDMPGWFNNMQSAIPPIDQMLAGYGSSPFRGGR